MGAPTPDAATFRKISMSKRKNSDAWWTAPAAPLLDSPMCLEKMTDFVPIAYLPHGLFDAYVKSVKEFNARNFFHLLGYWKFAYGRDYGASGARRQRSFTGLGVKPQDMTALSIDYVITLTGGAPSGGR